MIIDDIDLQILRQFFKQDKPTSWTIMKKIYPKGKDLEHMRIRKKIERMERDNLIFVSSNPKEYILIKDNVKLNKLPKIKKFLSLKIDKKWEIFEL